MNDTPRSGMPMNGTTPRTGMPIMIRPRSGMPMNGTALDQACL